MQIDFSKIKFDEKGLVPAVIQDVRTNSVVMLAYMNEASYEKTMELGLMTYWSRSRKELWTKGLTSGHVQHVKEIYLDCDNDTILAKVIQEGPACHTGAYSCFFKEILP